MEMEGEGVRNGRQLFNFRYLNSIPLFCEMGLLSKSHKKLHYIMYLAEHQSVEILHGFSCHCDDALDLWPSLIK